MIVMHVGDAKKAEGIQKIAKDLGEKVLSIGGKDLDRTLISFSMGKEMRKNVKLPPLYAMPELLLFVGMADAKLDLFLEKGAISRAQHDKSLGDLREKMHIG